MTGFAAKRVEIFEDFLCPHSARLHQEVVESLIEALGDDACRTLKIMPVNLLDKLSRPPGYSIRAGAIVVGLPAALRANMRKMLYLHQPRAFGDFTSFTDDNLINMGISAGIPAQFLREAVANRSNYDQVIDNLEKLKSVSFGQLATPTVRIDGKQVPGYQIHEKMSELLTNASDRRDGTV